MEIKGTFVKVIDVRKGVSNDKPWAVANFLIRAGDNRIFCFEWFDERCEEIKEAKVGGNIKIDFKIFCREYKDKYYTSLRVNTIEFEKGENDNNTDVSDGLPF